MKKNLILLSLFSIVSTAALAEQVRFLQLDNDALQARTDLIQHAKSEILTEYFAVTDDDVSTSGIALLCEASKRGVKVRVLMDALSNSVKKSTIAATYQNCKDQNGNLNIEFRLFNPLNFTQLESLMHRDHDKMLAVDGHTMIVGGRNVDKKYFGLDEKRNFKDLDMLINGKVVAEAVKYYKELWDKDDVVKKPNLEKFNFEKLINGCEGNPDHYMCQKYLNEEIKISKRELAEISLRMDKLIAAMKAGKMHVKYNNDKNWFQDARTVSNIRLLSNSTKANVSKNSHQISDELYSIFSKAQHSVLILSPYLIPNERVSKMFKTLINRGVTIKIITNSLKSTDNLFAQAGFKAAKQEMIDMGIELYEYNLVHTTHAKTAVVDDEISLIGTFNLDPRSSQINREIGIVVKDANVAADLTKIINHFKSESLLVGFRGEEVNIDFQNEGVGSFKKGAVKVIEQVIPLIKDQL
jgi:phosphatidylserine/phosphatidylglycerophosphate/cardiolipin synthase-like enzyme